MRKLWWVLLFTALFSACAQTPSENGASAQSNDDPDNSSRRGYFFRVDASCEAVGFSIRINDVVLLVVEDGVSHSSRTELNDWMVSGTNRIDITVSWSDSAQITANAASASFRLLSNNRLLREFRWSPSSRDNQGSNRHTFSESFRADGFPRVLLERGERVASSAGILPREDQAEIAALGAQLRTAFIEKNINGIDELLRTKYTDLGRARFTTAAAMRAATNRQYREMMDKPGYTVSFSGRDSFFSVADDRAVLLAQGRIGFPEPAIIISWREGGRTVRWVMDLYFAKINGEWVIIR